MINIHSAVLRGSFVTAASRICGKNAHVRSHTESWSRPQMRIHDIRFRVETLAGPQLRIYDYFVEFFLCVERRSVSVTSLTNVKALSSVRVGLPNLLLFLRNSTVTK